MGLNTFDPIIDFGKNVRLTLSAVGQLACPAQALWILSAVMDRIDTMKHARTFTKLEQLQAYRSWLFMRCRQVWPAHEEPVTDHTIRTLSSFWSQYHDLSLEELMYPMRWEGKIDGTVSIAAILDHLIRIRDGTKPTAPDVEPQPPKSIEIDEVPVFDMPVISDDINTVGCMCAEFCTILFTNPEEPPVHIQPRCGSTISQFLNAHEKLVGPFGVESIVMDGQSISGDHVMEEGQVIVIKLGVPTHTRQGPSCLLFHLLRTGHIRLRTHM